VNNEDEFEKATDNLIALAMNELHAFLDNLDYSKPYECKQAVLEFMRYLGEKWEQASAEVARMEYEEMRGGTDDGFEVKAYTGLRSDDFIESVEYYCKYLFGQVQDGR
jgi:hypothetical protein